MKLFRTIALAAVMVASVAGQARATDTLPQGPIVTLACDTSLGTANPSPGVFRVKMTVDRSIDENMSLSNFTYHNLSPRKAGILNAVSYGNVGWFRIRRFSAYMVEGETEGWMQVPAGGFQGGAPAMDNLESNKLYLPSCRSNVPPPPPVIKGRHDNRPSGHNGTPFTIDYHFDKEPSGISYKTIRDNLFTVTGGSVTKARRLTRGSNLAWQLTVQPEGAAQVILTPRFTQSCDDAHAVCTTAGVRFAEASKIYVSRVAALLSIPTVTATEGTDATLDFVVKMSAPMPFYVNITYQIRAGTATATEDFNSHGGLVVFEAGETETTVSIPIIDDTEVEDAESVRLELGSKYTGESGANPSVLILYPDVNDGLGWIVDDDGGSAPPVVGVLSAAFENVPARHDGIAAFTVDLRFSEEPDGLSYRTISGGLIDVSGGSVTKARRLVPGKNRGWQVTVQPSGGDAVTLSVRGTDNCKAAFAVCTKTGRHAERKLQAGATATIAPEPPISATVADTEVQEAEGATLDFVVTLSRAPTQDMAIWYRTYNGTATAGEDYVAVLSSFTVAPGETTKTVSVSVLDDAHDEGAETVNFWLTGRERGEFATSQFTDPHAIGTIRNSDPMPAAWIARFGRTVAEQVFDVVEARLEAVPKPGMEVSLAGQRIGGAALPENVAERQEANRSRSLSDWLNGETDPARRQNLDSRTMAERDLLTGSSFALTAATKGSGLISVWGRGAVTRFAGREGDLSVDGEVASGMLGADWTEGAWKSGLLVSHSLGDGGYRGASAGTVTSTLTGIYPWGRYALSERLSVWGVAGYGEGSLTLRPEEQAAIRTDLDLWMAGAGLRGVLVDGGTDGPTLAAKSDAMIVRTASDAVSGGSGNVAAAEAEVTRLRVGLEGSQPFQLVDGATLTPSVEIGVRHDGGDAETGFIPPSP